MKAFTEPMRELAGFAQLEDALENGQTPVQIEGCIDAAKCHVINSLGTSCRRRLIITYSDVRAKEICSQYSFFDKNVKFYPAKDTIFFNADIHSDLITGQRLAALRPLMDGDPVTIVTTVDGLTDRILPLEYLKSFCIELAENDTLSLEGIASRMVRLGYERVV